MKKKLVTLLAALMLVGATTTAFAAPSPEINSPEINSPEIDSPTTDVGEALSPEELEDLLATDPETALEALFGAIQGNITVSVDAEVDVNKIAVADLKAAIELAKKLDDAKVLAAFDIKVEADGAVTITVPVKADPSKHYVVLHGVDVANNVWETITNVTVSANGDVTFTLDGFSPVVIVEVDSLPGTDKPADKPVDPDSPETGAVVVFPMIAMAGLAGAVVCGKKINK